MGAKFSGLTMRVCMGAKIVEEIPKPAATMPDAKPTISGGDQLITQATATTYAMPSEIRLKFFGCHYHLQQKHTGKHQHTNVYMGFS